MGIGTGREFSSQLIIRRANIRDADEILWVEQSCFSQPWTKEDIEQDIAYNELVYIIVACTDDKIVGFINVQVLMDECDIRRIAVLPEYQNRRIASILMNTMINFTDMIGVKWHTLEVRAGNEYAKHLYRDFGFMESSRRENYYGPDDDAILMTRIGDPLESDPATQA